jgi:2-methylcitrate dehydratase PrpD
MGLIDCIGIMTEILAPGADSSTITFDDREGPAPETAWIDGTAAHAPDYGDVGLRGQPPTDPVPAILAESEHLGSFGADTITAYVAACLTGKGSRPSRYPGPS